MKKTISEKNTVTREYPPPINWQGFPRRAIHLDFHTMPGVSDVGSRFNAEKFAGTLKAAHVDYITLFAKCNLGFAYYPTRSGIIHPGLEVDLLGSMVEACHQHDIRVAAYFNIGLDHENAVLHRDWCKLTPEGKVYDLNKLARPGSNFFRTMCFQTEYRSYLLRMMEEVLRSYPVDGLFLDCICKHYPCLGVECINVMEENNWDPDNEADVLRCSSRVTEQFLRDVEELAGRLRSNDPWFKLYFNGAGYQRQPTHLELEILPTGGWGYDCLPSEIRFARTLGKPYFTMTGRFHGSWGDYGGVRPEASLEFDLFNSLANGGTCSVGDHMHPRGELDQDVYKMIGRVFGRVKELEPWTFGARNKTEIALLVPSREDAPELAPREVLQGAARLLMELKHQFDICSDATRLERYSLIILPDCITIDAELAKALQKYLAGGGKILSSGSSGLDPEMKVFAIPEYCLHYNGPDPANTLFFKPASGMAKDLGSRWITIYNTGIEIRAKNGAQTLASLALPYFNKYSWDWRHENYYVPPLKAARRPAVAQCGDNIIHIAFPLFGAYFEHAVVAYKTLVRNCIARLLPEPLLQVGNMPSFGQATVTELKTARMIHLLAYVPELRGRRYQIIEEPIVLRDISIGLRLDGKSVSKVYLAPERKVLDYEIRDDRVWITVPEVAGYQVVVVE